MPFVLILTVIFMLQALMLICSLLNIPHIFPEDVWKLKCCLFHSVNSYIFMILK